MISKPKRKAVAAVLVQSTRFSPNIAYLNMAVKSRSRTKSNVMLELVEMAAHRRMVIVRGEQACLFDDHGYIAP